jgi:pyridoxamine 5'-phosphate oxidase
MPSDADRCCDRAAREAPAAHNVAMADHGKPLREQDVDSDPLRQIAIWKEEARAAGVREPEAAALASAGADARPSVRMLLVKSFDERGFVFFTNYESQKGRELRENPSAALLFHWDPLGRQVRISGEVTRTSASETAAYVHSRPRASQLSALASPQSDVVESRAALELRVAELTADYRDRELPVPENWGGFRLLAATIELWQQRSDRLHDRLRYTRAGSGWSIERLAP